MTNNYLVYAHIRPSTGAVFYIGKGKQKRVRASANRNIHWRRIVAKEGGFDYAIVADGLSEQEAFALEIETIAKYRSDGVALCNMTNGGDGVSGYRMSDAQRAAISARFMGRPAPNKGISPSAEAREKMRNAKLGKKLSAEHIRKVAEAKRGHIVSEETRKLLAERATGKFHSRETKLKRAKAVICTTTGSIYASMQEAADQLGVWKANICKVCKGELAQTGGYKFAYAEALTT